jgi:hypothetical protein
MSKENSYTPNELLQFFYSSENTPSVLQFSIAAIFVYSIMQVLRLQVAVHFESSKQKSPNDCQGFGQWLISTATASSPPHSLQSATDIDTLRSLHHLRSREIHAFSLR